MPTSPSIDRLPPHAFEAEQSVLGSILIEPKLISGVLEANGAPEMFYDLRHQYLFACMKAMFSAGVPIDMISLVEALRRCGQLEQVGGMAYCSSLQDTVTSTQNFDHWFRIIQDKHILRRIIQAGTAMVGKVYDQESVTDELLDDVEKMIMGISSRGRTSNIVPVMELVQQAIEDIEALYTRKGSLTGLSSGFCDFDHLTMGLQPTELTIIAARPSIGKTSLLLNMIEHMAIDDNTPCGMFSLEMKDRSLIRRMLCSRSRVNARSIQDGFMAERDFPKLTGAAARIAGAPIYIDDESSLTVMQIRARARRMVEQWGVKMIGVDYLQLVNSSRRREKRHEEVADVSNGLKALAAELNIPVVVLSQLSRSVVKDGKSRRPSLADLRESGSIEQDADVVGMLYNTGTDEEEQQCREAIPVTLYIAKQRNGPTGDVHLTFLRPFTRFESASKVSQDDVPHGDPSQTSFRQYPDN